MILKKEEIEEVILYIWHCPKCHIQNEEEVEHEPGDIMQCCWCGKEVEIVD